MDNRSLMFVEPPDLSDEAATEMLDFLYELTTAFENPYATQLRRCYQASEIDRPQTDLFEDFDDELPDF